MRANLNTAKESEQRYFHKGGCDCRECREQDRVLARRIVTGLALIAAALLLGYAVVRMVSW